MKFKFFLPVFNIVQSNLWAHKLEFNQFKVRFLDQKCARFRTTLKHRWAHIFKHIQTEILILAENAPILNIVGPQNDSWAHKLKHSQPQIRFLDKKMCPFSHNA